MSDFLDALALRDNNIIDEKFYKLPEEIDFTFENLDIKYDATKQQSYLFYVESPTQEEIGYREDLRAFFIKALPYTSKYYKDQGEYFEENNTIDGDTMYFDLDSIVDNNTAFKIGDKAYTSFSKFLKNNKQNNLIMRLLGINCAELPHYQEVTIETNELPKYKRTVPFAEARKNLSLYVLKSLYDSDGNARLDNEQIDFFITQENYCEVLEESTEDDDKNITNLRVVYKNETNEHEFGYLKEAKACQRTLIDLLNGASDIRLVIDQQSLNRKPSNLMSPYDTINWLTTDGVLTKTFALIQQLNKQTFGYQKYRYETFNAPGQDTYGRSLGAVYVKTWVEELQSEVWVNAAKYVLFHNDKYTEGVPAYSSNPNEAYHDNFFSPIFKLSTYNKDHMEILDGFTNVTSKLIEERNTWYSSITGLDIDYIKENTVILGDSVLTVPPMNIRSSTETDHLKIPLLRSRGSIVKSLPRSQKVIEIDVYFNNDEGINGVAQEIRGKSGQIITYYMNGLRSIIAMFKLTPFLPIENNYINNRLMVDAVTLINMSVSTVPNYPKCLKATLTLAEFNYSIFMPELPESDDHNTFSQSIHYPAMRWYYQRLLQKGDTIKGLDFNSESYIKTAYGPGSALVPMSFSDSNATFYIPNRAQLETRLEIMNDPKPVLTQDKLTEEMRAGAKRLKEVLNNITSFATDPALSSALSQFFMVTYYNPKADKIMSSPNLTTPAISYSSNVPVYPVILPGESNMYYNDRNSSLIKMPLVYEEGVGVNVVQFSLDQEQEQFAIQTHTNLCLTPVYNSFNNKFGLFGPVDCFVKVKDDVLTIGAIVPLPQELAGSSYELKVIAKKVCSYLNISAAEADDVISYTSNGQMGVPIEVSYDLETFSMANLKNQNAFKIKGYDFNGILPPYKFSANGVGVRVIDYLYGLVDESQDGNIADAVERNLANEKRDTMLNEAMGLKFVKYDTGDILIEQITLNYGNTFSNMTLSMMDGKAYQYCGAQDMQIQLSLITSSEFTINALTHLPELSAEYARNYRKVLNCWPLRIDCQLTKLFGVCEVLIENVQTETIPNQPGVSRVTLTLTAVDRTVRRREALARIDTASNAGSISLGNRGQLDVKTYFDLKDSLAKAELYPDLELPTVDELLEAGFEIYRDKNVNNQTNRVFVDPDFYFIYGQALGCEIFRNNFLKAFEQETSEYDLTDMDGAYTQFVLRKNGQMDIIDKNKIATKQRSDYELTIKPTYDNKDYSKEIYKAVSDRAKCSLKLSQTLAEIGTPFWNITGDAKIPFRESACDLMPQLISDAHKQKRQSILDGIDSFLSKSIESCYATDPWTVADGSKTIEGQIEQFKSLVFATMKGVCAVNNILMDLMYVDFKKPEVYDIIPSAYVSNTADSSDSVFYNKMVDKLIYILLAYADTFSGPSYYNNQTIVIGDDADAKQSINWQARTYINSSDTNPIPFCKVYSNTGSVYATSLEQSLKDGYCFGPFGIRTYTAEQLKELFPNSSLDKNASYFLDPYYVAMQLSGDAEGIKAHKTKLMTQPGYAAIAAFRQLVVLYRYYIQEEKLCSLYEMIRSEAFSAWAAGIEKVTDVTIENMAKNGQEEIRDKQKEILKYFLEVLTTLSFEKYPTNGERKAIAYEVLHLDKDDLVAKAVIGAHANQEEIIHYYRPAFMAKQNLKRYEDAQKSGKDEETIARYKKLYDICINYENVEVVEFAQDIIEMVQNFQAENDFNQEFSAQTLKQIIEDEGKMFTGRMIAMAFSLLDSQNIHPLIMEKNVDALNNLMSVAAKPDISTTNSAIRKFIYALDGRDIINVSNIADIPATLEGQYKNYISERISNERSKDPRSYLRDSFFDMIKNDKRGRMLRAYPTYYMFFVDEGREIGLWKLHDNFYSSTAIAEIEITKSRKIASDTAHIVLSNLFNSYTQDDKDFVYDLDNPANNVGMKYKVQDAFNALFSPRALFTQEEKARLNAEDPITVTLTPGTRMHIRMGYGSNASELPIVFNGQLVEISNGEACEIVAQGDGSELLNPIQGFTDSSDIQNQGKFAINKFFANWLSVGATPRTIMSSLLTADGSWMDDKIQKISNGYIKATNPFGIYHFGDMKFNTIFKGSECVQNLFEANSRASYEFDRDYDLNVGLESYYKTQDTPVISIDINGKNAWDILHVCGSVSPDYKVAVVPFELRSSIFMGSGRDYYAYEYGIEKAIEENNSYIYEKRKPFEQYHYYTSYSDIIANNIVADASQVRTNAVGIYNETRSFGSIKTKQTDRLFVDFD